MLIILSLLYLAITTALLVVLYRLRAQLNECHDNLAIAGLNQLRLRGEIVDLQQEILLLRAENLELAEQSIHLAGSLEMVLEDHVRKV